LKAIQKLALIGCGAVSHLLYMPVLKQISECRVEFFVDTNLSNAEQAAREYGGGRIASDYKTSIDKVDAAIVAVPNNLHSLVSVDFLAAGRHVLCEKPMANNVENAKRMIEASRRSGARLAINLFKRRYKCYHRLKDLLNRSFVGRINRIEYQEGVQLSWPFSSSYLLRKERSGGGVLIDLGAHAIDMLGWLFGKDWELVSYRDDGLGRIESSCVLDLSIKWQETRIPCHLELSYARRLGRKMVLETDWCRLSVDEQRSTNDIHLLTGNGDLRIGDENTSRPTSSSAYVADQIRSFIRGEQDDCLAGEDALSSLRFIEECYEKREDLNHPWAQIESSAPTISRRPQRILIVGASGFLGSRLAEILSMGFAFTVRGTYHKPENAVRVARLPIDLVECDVLDNTQVLEVVKGCDVVVNCAIGTSSDSDATRVYVEGMQNLLEASKLQRVRKFVHISTAAVHNFKQGKSEIDESCAYRSSRDRNAYESGKISQEEIVKRFAKSIPTVILRPTIIYGPYSKPWVITLIDRLKNGSPTLVEGDGIANLVYVDDVIQAIMFAIENDNAKGRTMIINNDNETVHWSDYVSRFANLTGTSPNILPKGPLSAMRLRKFLSLSRDSTSRFSGACTAHEIIAFLARIPRKRMAKYEAMSREEHENLTCRSKFSSALAKSICGWSPRTSFAEGSRKTIEYAEWAGLGLE
jgi:nucleoside-diphosphate-sugar epimerase/predicted dehydrogenase